MENIIIPLAPFRSGCGQPLSYATPTAYVEQAQVNISFRRVCYEHLRLILEQVQLGKEIIFQGRIAEDIDPATGETCFTLDPNSDVSQLLFRAKLTVNSTQLHGKARDMYCASIKTAKSVRKLKCVNPTYPHRGLPVEIVGQWRKLKRTLADEDIDVSLVYVDREIAVFAAAARTHLLSDTEICLLQVQLTQLLEGSVNCVKVHRLGSVQESLPAVGRNRLQAAG